MFHQCEVTLRQPKYLKLIYKESVKLNKSYSVVIRVTEKLEFFEYNNYAPLGYLDLDGLDLKAVKNWDEQAIIQQAKLSNKLLKKPPTKDPNNQNIKQQKNTHSTKSNKKNQTLRKSKSKKKQNQNQKQNEKQKQIENQQQQQSIQTKDKFGLRNKSSSFDGFYHFIVYKDGGKDADDIIILDIHTQSRALKRILEAIATSSAKKSSNPLAFQPSKQFNTSLMSSENPEQRYRGFLNLAMILLVVLNIRNIVNNVQKYGIQEIPSLNMHYHSYIFLIFGLGIHLALGYLFTYFQFKGTIPNRTGLVLNILNVVGLFLSNIAYTVYFDPGVFSANVLTMMTSILSLKLMSYIHFNQNTLHLAATLRKQLKTSERSEESTEVDDFVKGEVKANLDNIVNVLTIQRLAFFILAPTLCYQLQYPRNAYIRKVWLGKRILEYILSTLVMNVIVIQYVLPELEQIKSHYLSPQFSYSQFAFKILELSVPVMIYWVLMFYSFFHVMLNIQAELTRFGDRAFYLDWWNCKDHDEYWKKWNLPVHNWMLRHLYIPLTGAGLSKAAAGFAVFFVSAVYHEYWIGVPLQVISFWAFLAIMIQAPLISFQKIMEKKLGIRNSQLGNLVFWISFCFVGQPLVVFAYYYLHTSKQS